MVQVCELRRVAVFLGCLGTCGLLLSDVPSIAQSVDPDEFESISGTFFRSIVAAAPELRRYQRLFGKDDVNLVSLVHYEGKMHVIFQTNPRLTQSGDVDPRFDPEKENWAVSVEIDKGDYSVVESHVNF